MTIKTVLAGIPIGGSKGGMATDTRNHLRDELLRQIANVIGSHIKNRSYIPGTDIGFTETDVNALYRFSNSKSAHFQGEIPVGEACAIGIAESLEYIAKNAVGRVRNRTVALEGFGRIGAPTARLLASRGFSVVAVSDITGTLYDPSGLDVNELSDTREIFPEDYLIRYSNAHSASSLLASKALYTVDAEILIPGARALTIHSNIADQIKAKVVCPISNGPLTLNAEAVLARRGIVSIPDVISNAGGIIASFAQHLGADSARTEKAISDIITHNLESVLLNLPRGEIPKKVAVTKAMDRLERFKRHETSSALEFLLPWVKSLGINAIFSGIKQYVALKV
jgi:glutamate dehydrogenase/leucine dehydrogenase